MRIISIREDIYEKFFEEQSINAIIFLHYFNLTKKKILSKNHFSF